MDQLEIVLGLIEQDGIYHLQYRSGPKTIGAARMIGCFGGKINSNEDPSTAICRELTEETNLVVTPEEIRELGVVEVISDYQLKPIQVIGRVFHIVIDPVHDVKAREGKLISLSHSEVWERLHEMTPGTKACFEQFVRVKDV